MVTIAQSVAEGARFFNREQSWLQFNLRVLEEALDDSMPLIERARFLAIVSNNLDEFVMVRLAELHTNRDAQEPDPAGLLPKEQLNQARTAIADMVRRQYECWSQDVEPKLAEQGFRIVSPQEWNDEDHESASAHFTTTIEPILTPLAVDPTRPFPLLSNRGLNIAVSLRPEGDLEGELQHALVAIPKTDRLVALIGSEPGRFALLGDIIEYHVGRLFPGHSIIGTCQFRVTRDASLDLEEDAPDLLSELQEELQNRGRGAPVRLEVRQQGNDNVVAWLQSVLRLENSDIHRVNGPLDLTLLFGLDGKLLRPDLAYSGFSPKHYEELEEDQFGAIRYRDWMLHHPFDSFDPIVSLVRSAADDDRVLAIKQTLYRVSGDSPIVKALMRAARAGKQVTVLVELKARFDEEANIRWAKALEEAGAHVVYGLVGLKVHAKLLAIIRRDEDGIRRYCQLGTGNYNDKTAKIYTDLSYLTCNEAVGRDVGKLFNVLTGFAAPPEWERLAVAPTTMRPNFNRWIQQESDHAAAGRGGHIIAKFNSLVDTAICDELYAASKAGVKIDLIVRGMCILRPGIPGLSENIRVISVVGRFLEHSRIYYFANNGSPVLGISSADWMSRNLDRRVESLVRIENPVLIQELKDLLDLYLADRVKSRVLFADGSHANVTHEGEGKPLSSQDELLKRIKRKLDDDGSEEDIKLIPIKA